MEARWCSRLKALPGVFIFFSFLFFPTFGNEEGRKDEGGTPTVRPPLTIDVFQTARNSEDRLDRKENLVFGEIRDPIVPSVFIDSGSQFQTIEGFGGAFTEAAADNFYKMSPVRRERILTDCFDPVRGNGYTLCRTHINSCDFSLGSYSYADAGDAGLDRFSIERDKKVLIPMIREAMTRAGTALRLFASPWSPPAWMKTNGEMKHGGKLKPEFRDAWARYFCRYLDAYRREGIPIWGLTVQNEPEAVQPWESCIYSAEEERDFVRDFLGPRLHQAGFSRIRLMIWDHNRDRMFERAKIVLDDPRAARYVWGVAFHWYVQDCFENVRKVHEAFPSKKLLFTEGCQENGPHVGVWEVGERYAFSMIHDLNNGTVGWVDWNLILDSRGGPNHVGNFCSAPIIVDPSRDRIEYVSSFYYIGHFSRFIKPGAKRIISASSRDDLETTAFLNPDGRIAVIVLNRSEREISFDLRYTGMGAGMILPPRSIRTLLFSARALRNPAKQSF